MKIQLRSSACAAPLADAEVSPSETRLEAPPRQAGVVIRWRSAGLIMRGWQPRAAGRVRSSRSWWARLSKAMVRVLDRIADYQDQAQSRRELLSLDDRALRDLGIDRSTAHYLSKVPFWYRHR